MHRYWCFNYTCVDCACRPSIQLGLKVGFEWRRFIFRYFCHLFLIRVTYYFVPCSIWKCFQQRWLFLASILWRWMQYKLGQLRSLTNEKVTHIAFRLQAWPFQLSEFFRVSQSHLSLAVIEVYFIKMSS